jgi:hypothetical protein
VREDGLGEGDGAEEHRVHERPQVAHVDLLDGSHRAVTGVVDEHVDGAEALERRRHGSVDVLGAGDVQRGGQHPLGRGRDKVVECLRAAGGGDHAVAGPQRRAGELAAEARGAPRDEPDAGGLMRCHGPARYGARGASGNTGWLECHRRGLWRS